MKTSAAHTHTHTHTYICGILRVLRRLKKTALRLTLKEIKAAHEMALLCDCGADGVAAVVTQPWRLWSSVVFFWGESIQTQLHSVRPLWMYAAAHCNSLSLSLSLSHTHTHSHVPAVHYSAHWRWCGECGEPASTTCCICISLKKPCA